MKIRNTTDFDTGTLRSLLRSVVREVEATLSKHHPLGWSIAAVHARAELILEHCDVWIRQARPERRLGTVDERVTTLRADAAEYRRLAPDRPGQGLAEAADECEERARELEANGPEEQVWSTGRASLSGRKLRMTIGGSDAVLAVWLMRHEVWHLFGVRHPDFPAAVMREDAGSLEAVRRVYGIDEGAKLPPPKPKPKPTAEEREAAILADIAEKRKRWTTKLRRAQTAIAKLRTRERYYERLAAKRGACP